jgi:hypothetical protein
VDGLPTTRRGRFLSGFGLVGRLGVEREFLVIAI